MSFANFMSEYGVSIVAAIAYALFGCLGAVAKNLYKKYINDKTKQGVVKTCVMAVEQMYKNLHGEDKLNECIGHANAMLAEKGIFVSESEMKMLVESAVGEFNRVFNSEE